MKSKLLPHTAPPGMQCCTHVRKADSNILVCTSEARLCPTYPGGASLCRVLEHCKGHLGVEGASLCLHNHAGIARDRQMLQKVICNHNVYLIRAHSSSWHAKHAALFADQAASHAICSRCHGAGRSCEFHVIHSRCRGAGRSLKAGLHNVPGVVCLCEDD